MTANQSAPATRAQRRTTMNRIRMTCTVDGLELSRTLSRFRFNTWIAVLGERYGVHFTKRGSVWICRRPAALEPICTGATLREAIRKARAHYRALAATPGWRP